MAYIAQNPFDTHTAVHIYIYTHSIVSLPTGNGTHIHTETNHHPFHSITHITSHCNRVVSCLKPPTVVLNIRQSATKRHTKP